jgi:aminopeptidase N
MKIFSLVFILFFSFSSFAQQIYKVDFISCNAFLKPNQYTKSISGGIIYEFEVKKSIDTIKIDAVNMQFENLSINNKSVKYSNTNKQLLLFEGFKIGKNTLTFSYEAKPKQVLYFNGNDENLQIWTQGQGKYTSHWLPSFDDVNEKVIFNLNIIFNKDFTVISNGNKISSFALKGIQTTFHSNENQELFHFQMQEPMSSYLVMLVIGKFEKQTTTTKSNTILEFYLDKKDALKFEPTYRYSKQIFDYLEQEIGINYPWKIYRQVPVRDFLYAGMENTTSTIFLQDFVVDSIGFNDKNYVNVNAHELAHQWFGNLVTAKSSKHHWLQEGFATYYALLAEKQIFGNDYFYNELNSYAKQLDEASKYDTIPLLNETASSLTFYRKGAWALHVLREDIGAKKFKKAVKKYLKKYEYKNVDTDNFLKIVKQISRYDIERFKNIWLKKSGFEMEDAQKYLNKNKFIQEFENLKSTTNSISDFEAILKSDIYFPLKQYIIYATHTVTFEERKFLLNAAMQTNNIQVRQAVAETLKIIPDEFKNIYESLLEDNSYKNKELALQNLCINFPDDKIKYLNYTKKWSNKNSENFEFIWLKLAIETDNFEIENKSRYYKTLLNYADDLYESSTRQNALEVLLEINPLDKNVIELLFKATQHIKWQFTKFARENIRLLLQNENYRQNVKQTMAESTIDKSVFLKFLNEKL